MNESTAIPDARARWNPTACAYNNGEFISIKAYSGYSLAIGDPTATEYLLEPHVSDEELGTAVLNALQQSRFLSLEESGELRRNAKQNYTNWVQKLMDRYGYKTKRALFKNMKSCDIDLKEGVITIEHTNHEKLEAWGGEGIRKDDYVKVPADSVPAEIGAALRLAFSRCTGLGA